MGAQLDCREAADRSYHRYRHFRDTTQAEGRHEATSDVWAGFLGLDGTTTLKTLVRRPSLARRGLLQEKVACRPGYRPSHTWTMVRSEIQVRTEELLPLMYHLGSMYNFALLFAFAMELRL